jgi:cell division protein FtsQ
MTPPQPTAVKARPPIDPRIRQRRVAIRRSQGQRRLRWLVGALAAAVALVAAVALLHTALFSARVVTVSGAHLHTSTAAIVAAARLGGHPPLISVDPGATAARVEALPYVASAQVERHWPDGVVIAVTERVPVAVMAGPGGTWSVLDGHGRTLQVAAARPPGLLAFAVATPSGVLAPGAVGRSLPPDASVGLTVCRTLPPAFSAQVVSVTVAAAGTVSMGLSSGITVLIGTDDDLTAKYEDVAAIIAHASLQGATTIDVTVPQSPTVTG